MILKFCCRVKLYKLLSSQAKLVWYFATDLRKSYFPWKFVDIDFGETSAQARCSGKTWCVCWPPTTTVLLPLTELLAHVSLLFAHFSVNPVRKKVNISVLIVVSYHFLNCMKYRNIFFNLTFDFFSFPSISLCTWTPQYDWACWAAAHQGPIWAGLPLTEPRADCRRGREQSRGPGVLHQGSTAPHPRSGSPHWWGEAQRSVLGHGQAAPAEDEGHSQDSRHPPNWPGDLSGDNRKPEGWPAEKSSSPELRTPSVPHRAHRCHWRCPEQNPRH